MKRLSLIWALAAVVLILSMGGQAQVIQEKKTLEQRVEGLEKEVAELRIQCAGLTDALTAEAATVDGLVKYVREQAKSAKAMAATLDLSEQKGFTAGINFTSREILLAGWRQQLAAMQKDLPTGGKPEVKEEVVDPLSGARKRRQADR